MTTKEKIQNKIDQLNIRINKLINDRDKADNIMFEHENDAGTTYVLASEDYFHAVDKIDTLENVIAILEDYL